VCTYIRETSYTLSPFYFKLKVLATEVNLTIIIVKYYYDYKFIFYF